VSGPLPGSSAPWGSVVAAMPGALSTNVVILLSWAVSSSIVAALSAPSSPTRSTTSGPREAGPVQPGQVDQRVRTGQVSRMATNKQELLGAARAGEDIDGRPGVARWETSTQPMAPSAHPEGAVLVGRSLRMSMDTYLRIKAAASARGMTWSALVREWIDRGLEAAESGAEPDPIAELPRRRDHRR
jgi:hypothetical protein